MSQYEHLDPVWMPTELAIAEIGKILRADPGYASALLEVLRRKGTTAPKVAKKGLNLGKNRIDGM